ncbi:MAG: flagellar biosynthetic protein FliQ [Pseudomonadota bacterium]
MDVAGLVDLMRETAWTGLLISAPILTVALVVGIVIGLLQALTSIQELTLTFVPKLIAIVIVFVITATFMTNGLVRLFQDTILPMAEQI